MRGTKKGNVPLTDPRDIYEMVANQGARRLRSCILGIIPGDVVEAAMKECNKTLVSGNDKPLIDRVRDGIRLFEEKFSVTQEMIEKYIGCKCEAFSENDMIRLNNVYRSLRDGMASREQYFDLPTPGAGEAASEVRDPFAEQQKTEEKKSGKRGVKKDAKEEAGAGSE